MTFHEFLAEIKTQLSQYFESGLIDDASVLKWVKQGLKKFGATIMVDQETIIEIEKSKGQVPDNFYSLVHAVKLNKDFIECRPGTEDTLVKSLFWTDVQLKKKQWDIKTGECIDESIEETTYREKTYINKTAFIKHYNNPEELRLSKAFKKSICASSCLNKYRSNSPFEINISGTTLRTNFPSGDVYIRYKGLELDEDGIVIIPDTPKGELETYLTYFVKRNILEIATANRDDSAVTLFKYYQSMEGPQLLLALTEVKFMGLTPQSMYKLKGRNQRERRIFERLPRK